MRRHRFLIIGAGPTGLGAAWRLKSQGQSDFLVLERESQVGGLSASFKDSQGFSWDIGGHVLFSHPFAPFDDLLNQALGPESWLQHRREAWIWMENRFVPYPLQYNIRHLSSHSLDHCLKGLEESAGQGHSRPVANFRDWILDTFGTGLAEAFFFPYNRKVWGHPLEQMDWRWISERIATPDLPRIRENIASSRDDNSWGPNRSFRFPRSGGTGAIWKAVARLAGEEQLTRDAPVTGIDAVQRHVVLATGERIGFEHLLSTMPLDQLCHTISGGPDRETLLLSRHLLHSSCHAVGIGLRGPTPEVFRNKSWMYFPEGNCPFYRVTVFSNYSPSHVPDTGHSWSLLAEVSSSQAKPVDTSAVVDSTIEGLLATGLINSRSDILSTWKYSAEYAYPTPSLDRDRILDLVLPALEAREIYSRGRFGAWRYEIGNQDHSCRQGIEWADRMLHRSPESLFERRADGP